LEGDGFATFCLGRVLYVEQGGEPARSAPLTWQTLEQPDLLIRLTYLRLNNFPLHKGKPLEEFR